MNMDEVVCFICGENGHFAKKCKNHKGKKNQPGHKSTNVTIGNPSGSGYNNYLPSVFSVFQSNDWWIDTGANIHVCTDISMFILPDRTRFYRHDGERLACFCSWYWFGRSEVHFGKDHAA